VSDRYQHLGLGTELLRLLLEIGRDEGLERISAEILRENQAMQRICRALDFTLRETPEVVQAWIDLT
jgi:acetyltransferase